MIRSLIFRPSSVWPLLNSFNLAIVSRICRELVWHLELANVLAVGERNRRITPARTSEFSALIGGLPIVIYEQTASLALSTVLDLARSERPAAWV